MIAGASPPISIRSMSGPSKKSPKRSGSPREQVSSDLRELEATSNSKQGEPRKEKGPDTTDRAEEIEAVKAEKAAAAAEGAAALEAV